MHLLYERRAAEEDRAHFSGKISILETLVEDPKQGQTMDPQEVERLRKLAGVSASHAPKDVGRNESKIGWKEVLLGRKPSEQTLIGSASRDQGDWERRRCTLVVIRLQIAHPCGPIYRQSRRNFVPLNDLAGLPGGEHSDYRGGRGSAAACLIDVSLMMCTSTRYVHFLCFLTIPEVFTTPHPTGRLFSLYCASSSLLAPSRLF